MLPKMPQLILLRHFFKCMKNVHRKPRMPWEKHIMPDLTPVTRGAPKNAPGVVTTQRVDELVLKRAKPLARAKSTLEASLGITRKTR